jgi:chromosome segregation and condensation protein ScpB
MGRVEAVIFAASEPVTREVLARVVGRDCNLDLIIADIRDELRGRPYDLASVAGGWQHRTKKGFADAIHAATGVGAAVRPLSRSESLVLMAIAYFQPIARGELSHLFGREVSRDLIGGLRAMGVIAAGPRSPRPGAPYAYVTTKNIPGAVRIRVPARSARHQDAGGRRPAQQGQAAAGEFPDAIRGDGDERDDPPDAAETAIDGSDA